LSTPERGWVFTGRARRDLQRLDPPVQRRIIDALDRLTGEPPAGDVVKLTGVDHEWRLRVGDWRVRFQRDSSGIIRVLRVLPRGRAYRDQHARAPDVRPEGHRTGLPRTPRVKANGESRWP